MAETYKHSYKSGEILMTSLSVYNTDIKGVKQDISGDPESGIIIVSIIFCQEQDTIQLEKRHGN